MSIRAEIKNLPTTDADVRKFSWSVGGVFLLIWLVFIGPVH